MSDSQFETCIKRIKAGDQNGLKEIYDAYITFIYAVIVNILKNKEDAEDVTSEFFIKLWSIADQYQVGGKHKAYLARIAHNMAIDYLRRTKREQPTEEIAEVVDRQAAISAQSTHIPTPEEKVVGEMTSEELLAKLKPTEQEVLNMKIMGEMTFQEIAQTLDIPMGTVTWRYRTAIQKLRTYYDEGAPNRKPSTKPPGQEQNNKKERRRANE
ncbi:MAG: RNA polymerase sigma factor [Clostridia bacterium]|nr:RNA polymerase sigma factor [Clostridia bacterium]